MTNTVTVLAESTGFSAVNTIWVLLGAALVFFMQAGFAMVETGFTRAKNAGNIIMKNLMDFCIGTPLFWLFGFGLMFGDGKFIGAYKGIADSTYASAAPDGVPFFAFLIFQTVFCATAATIVSGAMAERTKFISYCIYSAIISLLVYPIGLTGSGAAAGLQTSASMISQVQLAYIWQAALQHSLAQLSLVLVSVSMTRTARQRLSQVTRLHLAHLAALSFGSAGSDSTVLQQFLWKATLFRLQVKFS